MTLIKDLRQLGAIARTYLGDVENRKYIYAHQRCSCLEAGQGEIVVLLHGSAVTKSYWRQIMQYLAPHYRTIALEVPGYNVEKSTYHGRFTFKNLCQWLTDTLVALGVGGQAKLHLVGYCSGAALAAYFAASYPERVRTLSLISIPYIYIDPHMSIDDRKAILYSRWVNNEDEFYALLNKAFAEPPYVPAIAVKRYVRNMKDKRQLFEKMVQDTCSSSALLVSKLGQITCPTLALTGDRDSLSPVNYQHMLAKTIPRLQTAVLDSCSHLSIVEQPEEIARHMLTFLAQASVGST